MTTSIKCQSKDPAHCRFHGVAYAQDHVTKHVEELNALYREALSRNVYMEGMTDKINAAKTTLAESEANLMAFDGEWESQSQEITNWANDTEAAYSWGDHGDHDKKLKEYQDRATLATAIRIKKFNDASAYNLNKIENFPISRDDAREYLQANDCGAYLGVVEQPELSNDGKKRFIIAGTKGYIGIREDGLNDQVGSLRTFDSARTPDYLEDFAAKFSGGEKAYGYRNVHAKTGGLRPNGYPDFAQVGYEVLTPTHHITVDMAGNLVNVGLYETI
jgi:hypothetical protein